MKVFFGHQSVGYNVMKGINLLVRQFGGSALNYHDLRSGKDVPSDGAGFFAHAKVGRNGHPLQKLDEFDAMMRGGLGDELDVALVKLCYVDFNSKTDSRSTFRAYKKVITTLERDYPNIAFVYVTVPLEVDAKQANAVRTEFNKLIRDEYSATGRLWDIAAAESTNPAGKRVGGKRFEALYAGYSSDGGHLNEVGAVAVAAPFARLLASLRDA